MGVVGFGGVLAVLEGLVRRGREPCTTLDLLNSGCFGFVLFGPEISRRNYSCAPISCTLVLYTNSDTSQRSAKKTYSMKAESATQTTAKTKVDLMARMIAKRKRISDMVRASLDCA